MTDLGPDAPAAPVPLRVNEDLPERSFIWRRVMTFGLVIAGCWLIWVLSGRVHDEHLLHSLIRWLIGAVIALAFAYMTGAGLEEWASMVTALRTKRTILSGGQDKP